jgi:homoserine kinase type II
VAVYTDITEPELRAYLADFDLGALVRWKGIAEGVENSNFLVETDRTRLILTLFERRVNEADLPFFIGLMGHLAARGYPCPSPKPDRHGEVLKRLMGKPALLVSFLEGRPIEPPGVFECGECGRAAAELALAGRDFSMVRPNDLGLAAWRPMFERDREACAAFAPDLADLIAADLDALEAGWPKDLPQGVIHADLFTDNMFFKDGRFAGVIDFYFACNDALAYELAICLNAWACDDDGRIERAKARAMVQAYEQVRPLSEAERRAVPMLARGAAMRFFLTRLHDWRTTPKGALVKVKDPMEYGRKLAFHRAAAGDLAAYGLVP